MRLPGVAPAPDLLAPGPLVPGLSVRALFMLIGVGLSLVDYGTTGWLAVGIALSLAAAWWPQYLLGWGLILFLAAGRLAHHPGLSWRFLLLLAGLHLLQVVGGLALELPWRSWVQPKVFRAPLVRFGVIQVPTQLVAVLALLLLAPNSDGHRPLTIAGFALVGAVSLAGLALLLVGPRSS